MSIEAFTLTLPLVKVDEERRLIFARAAAEIADKSGEIMDYTSAKPQFQRWSDGYSARTNGLNKGNVRAMHNKQHASGKVVDMNFNDDDKAIDVCLKVSDDGDWKKCLDGVYTGVSVGGGYLKKWKDGALTRYTPIVRELSLVDEPCIPTAVFAELVKINGEVEQLQLRGVVRTFADMWANRPVEPPSFAEAWVARPKTFGELNKGYPTIPTEPGQPHYSSKALMISKRVFAMKSTADSRPGTWYYKRAPLGGLRKAYDESKHERDGDGKFSGDGAAPPARPEGYHMGLIGRLYDIKRRATGLATGAAAGAALGSHLAASPGGKLAGMIGGGLAGAYAGEKTAAAYSRAVESNPVTRTLSRLSVVG